MKKLLFMFAYLMSGAFFLYCGVPDETSSRVNIRHAEVSPEVTVKPDAAQAKPASELTELCKELASIKKFPGRDPDEQEDPVFAAIKARGNEIMPCLVDEITNETPMHDPRQAPVWQHYKVGDTAVFLLAYVAKNPELLTEMLPKAYRDEWRTNGVYAYFNYVSRSENRRQLQVWWRNWVAKRLKK